MVLLDVKGAYDRISPNRLVQICLDLGLPQSLCKWIESFLKNRRVQLVFDGQTQNLIEVETGIPQGSPVSPILFLIYTRELALASKLQEKGLILSYVDDISISITSKNSYKNCKALEEAVNSLVKWGKRNALEFDLDKTELIHF